MSAREEAERRYVPTTGDVCRAILGHIVMTPGQFDAWLNQHDREVGEAARAALAQEPTEAEVEAAARAINPVPWDPRFFVSREFDEEGTLAELIEKRRNHVRGRARAALLAAREVPRG